MLEHREVLKRTTRHDNHFSESEIKEYSSTSKTNQSHQFVLILISYYALYSLKSAYYIHFTLNSIDHYNLESNIKPVTDGKLSNFITYSCLISNCSQLTEDSNNFAKDLWTLPIFSLCNQYIRSYYTPLVNLGSVGLMTNMFIVYFIFYGSFIPIKQLISPIGNETLMFILAPNITRNQLKEKLKEIKSMFEFSKSMANTRNCQSIKLNVFREPIDSSHDDGEDDEDNDVTDYCQVSEEYIEDCLPAVRSDWWRHQMASIFCRVFVFFIIFEVIIGVWFVIFERHYIIWLTNTMHKYSTHMNKTKCSIWKQPDHLETFHFSISSAIHLENFDFKWNLYGACEMVPVIFLPCIAIGTVLTVNYVINCELSCWLNEIRRNMLFAIEVARIKSMKPSRLPDWTIQRRDSIKQTTNSCGMAEMRCRFIEDTYFRWCFFKLKPLARINRHSPGSGCPLLGQPHSLKVESCIAYEQLADQFYAIEDTNATVALTVMLDKLFINFRLFMDLTNHCSENVASFVLISNMLAYGLTIICVYLNRKIYDFSVYIIFALAFFQLMIVAFISISSNFHAEAKRLQPLFWTLIAQLNNSREERLVHLRSLWLTQTKQLDETGGLALSAYHFRVTYVNIIQVMIWSSTILVLAFKH